MTCPLTPSIGTKPWNLTGWTHTGPSPRLPCWHLWGSHLSNPQEARAVGGGPLVARWPCPSATPPQKGASFQSQITCPGMQEVPSRQGVVSRQLACDELKDRSKDHGGSWRHQRSDSLTVRLLVDAPTFQGRSLPTPKQTDDRDPSTHSRRGRGTCQMTGQDAIRPIQTVKNSTGQMT